MAGTDPLLVEELGRSVLFFCLVSLSRGYFGVSVELPQKMAEFYNLGITPAIPCGGRSGPAEI
jgi:histidine ammonia-lyase